MEKVDFTPKNELDNYITNDFNVEIYLELKEKIWESIKPLSFFNLLYEQYDVVLVNGEKPVSVMNHLQNLDLTNGEYYLLLYYLLRLLHKSVCISPEEGFWRDYQDAPLCVPLIRNEWINFGKKIFGETYEEKNYNQPIQVNQNDSNLNKTLFLNKFDNIHPQIVFQYFKTSLVDKEYYTLEELNEYLYQAFQLMEISERRFTLKGYAKKETINAIFYTYYKDVAGYHYDQSDRYCNLLRNYFEGFDSKVIKTNWAKGYKPKR